MRYKKEKTLSIRPKTHVSTVTSSRNAPSSRSSQHNTFARTQVYIMTSKYMQANRYFVLFLSRCYTFFFVYYCYCSQVQLMSVSRSLSHFLGVTELHYNEMHVNNPVSTFICLCCVRDNLRHYVKHFLPYFFLSAC